MYISKEIITNPSSNQKGIKIGPDAMRFKYVDDEIVMHSPKRVEGIIFDVGLDFVEILQKDHLIVTVLTDRITHVKWPDKHVREAVSTCKHDGRCNCVEFNRFPNMFNEKGERDYKMKKNKKQSKKGRRVVKADPHHCSHCGNYHSRLNPCRCKQQQRPCGCKSNRGNQQQRPCGCHQQHVNQFRQRPCCCHQQHVNQFQQRPCGCHEQYGNYQQRRCGCNDHHERQHYCSHCRDEHSDRHYQTQHSYYMNNNHCCDKKCVCFCDFAIPVCDNRFELRLAGLNDDLNFKFLQNRGRQVEMMVE